MTSVIESLNELLKRERGEVQAVADLIKEIADSDPDIADSARDVLETASWSCQGLYSRIEWLGGTPTLEIQDHTEELAERRSTNKKIEFLCSTQEADLAMTRSLQEKPILDKDTRDLVTSLIKAHEDAIAWCRTTLAEWSVG